MTALTDDLGVVKERYAYKPYGELLVFDPNWVQIPASVFDNPYTFTGRRLDSETGFYYYRNRFLHPQLGRFISRDPVEYEGGLNLYVFVSARPTVLVDPLGLKPRRIQIGSVYLIYNPNYGCYVGQAVELHQRLDPWHPHADLLQQKGTKLDVFSVFADSKKGTSINTRNILGVVEQDIIDELEKRGISTLNIDRAADPCLQQETRKRFRVRRGPKVAQYLPKPGTGPRGGKKINFIKRRGNTILTIGGVVVAIIAGEGVVEAIEDLGDPLGFISGGALADAQWKSPIYVPICGIEAVLPPPTLEELATEPIVPGDFYPVGNPRRPRLYR